MSVTITAAKREKLGSRAARKYRAEGRLPATIARPGQDTLHITVPELEAEKALASGVLTFSVSVEGAQHRVLLRDADRHCIKDCLQHLDLMEVNDDSIVTVDVPVHPNTLNCPGIKSGGMLEVMVRRMRVRGPVKNIPASVEISLAETQLGDTVYLNSVQLGEGVKALQHPRTAILSIIKTRTMKKAEGDTGDEGTEGAAAAAAAAPAKDAKAAPAKK
jgi:large subunit ribosomal protein L25